MSRVPQVVAFGGGGFSMESGNALLDDYVLAATGRERPKVCFLPTASGDADHYIVRFYRHFGAGRCEPSHVSLFRRDCGAPDPRSHLLEQDLVYVGGGCVRSMLGAWRAHGLDQALREAWAGGVVMCGLSAGSLCWFEQGLTAFHGEEALPVAGLGLLIGLQRGALRQGAAAAPGLPGGDRGRDGAGLGRRRRRGAALHGLAASRASWPRARTRAPTGSSAWRARRSRRRWRPSTWGRR